VRAIVVAAGELTLSARVLEAARRADLVIAADAGAHHLAALGRAADVVLGDFDSLAHGPDKSLDLGAAEIIRYPTAKDQTDTHLAIREAVRRGARAIIVLAALRGPRLDHGAANVLQLSASEFRRIDLRFLDGRDELRAVRRRAEITGAAGDLVTLLAVTPVVRGIATSGLLYPLVGESLARGDSRGVSNVLLAGSAVVTIERGVLLLVHRDGGDVPTA
jgi:thiamine pyrophosphokinase